MIKFCTLFVIKIEDVAKFSKGIIEFVATTACPAKTFLLVDLSFKLIATSSDVFSLFIF